jgi:hypothetical protein
MNEHGRKQPFLFQDSTYKDEVTGATLVYDRGFILWADESFIEEIKAMPGISSAYYGNIEKGRYDIWIDPRYDVDFVKKEIEAIIMCVEE